MQGGGLPSKLLLKNDTVDASTVLSTKVIGLYFSAHWCGPCRAFLPALVKFYEDVNKENKEFEIIFVSGDESDSDFDNYYKQMPWLAVPFDDDSREDLGDNYKVQSLPDLVLVDKDGKVKKSKAHLDIKNNPSKPANEIFATWKALY